MATRVKARAADLHTSDSYLWALSQAEALRAGRLEDLAHLAEELEGLAIATRSAVRSRTRTIIEHLLELQHSPAADPRHGWRRTVRVQRSGLRDDLTPEAPARRRPCGPLPRRAGERGGRSAEPRRAGGRRPAAGLPLQPGPDPRRLAARRA